MATSQTRQIDTFAYEHKDLLMVRSAGNNCTVLTRRKKEKKTRKEEENSKIVNKRNKLSTYLTYNCILPAVNTGSITTQAASKNSLIVGASDSTTDALMFGIGINLSLQLCLH